METIEETKKEEVKPDLPEFGPGDTVKVYFQVVEGDKERKQIFEGTVIKKKSSGISSTFTVRKISNGIGVERIFLHSPLLKNIVVSKRGMTRRAKLYYLRGKTGKAAKLKEKSFRKSGV